MDELSEAARRLMDLATKEDEPPAEAVHESWGMLAQRVQRESGLLEPSAVVERPVGSGMRWVGLAAAGLVVGVGFWAATRSTSSPPAPAPAVAPENATRTPSPAGVDAAPAPNPAVPLERRSPEPGGARLLDEAEAVLPDDPARALALLVQHADVDTDAELVPRRLALRVRCLCALKQIDDARYEATAFLERHGDSAFAATVRESCATSEAPP